MTLLNIAIPDVALLDFALLDINLRNVTLLLITLPEITLPDILLPCIAGRKNYVISVPAEFSSIGESVFEINFMLACGLNKIRVDS